MGLTARRKRPAQEPIYFLAKILAAQKRNKKCWFPKATNGQLWKEATARIVCHQGSFQIPNVSLDIYRSWLNDLCFNQQLSLGFCRLSRSGQFTSLRRIHYEVASIGVVFFRGSGNPSKRRCLTGKPNRKKTKNKTQKKNRKYTYTGGVLRFGAPKNKKKPSLPLDAPLVLFFHAAGRVEKPLAGLQQARNVAACCRHLTGGSISSRYLPTGAMFGGEGYLLAFWALPSFSPDSGATPSLVLETPDKHKIRLLLVAGPRFVSFGVISPPKRGRMIPQQITPLESFRESLCSLCFPASPLHSPPSKAKHAGISPEHSRGYLGFP